MKFGERLRKIREDRGFTLEQMGDSLGITRQGYRRFETKTEPMKTDVMLKLAEILDVKVEELYGFQEQMLEDLSTDTLLRELRRRM